MIILIFLLVRILGEYNIKCWSESSHTEHFDQLL